MVQTTTRVAGECRTHSKELLTELMGGSVAEPTALWEEGRMSQKSNIWGSTGQCANAEMNRNKEN